MLLALETSTRPGEVAVVHDGLATSLPLGGERDLDLASALRNLLGSRAALATVEGYGISIGPGSFTGLRVGLAFLKGLAFVHRRPVVAVPSLEVLALGLLDAGPSGTSDTPLRLPDGSRVLSVIDARRGTVFAALYRVERDSVIPDASLPEGRYELEVLPARVGAGPLWAVGDAARAVGGPSSWRVVSPRPGVSSALMVARCALARLHRGYGVDVARLEPVYHQLSGAEERLAAGQWGGPEGATKAPEG